MDCGDVRRQVSVAPDDPQSRSAGDVADAISTGSMPPWFYPFVHPKARLSRADRQKLIAGLAATFRKSPPMGGG